MGENRCPVCQEKAELLFVVNLPAADSMVVEFQHTEMCYVCVVDLSTKIQEWASERGEHAMDRVVTR